MKLQQDDAIRGTSGGNALGSTLAGLAEYPKRLRSYLHDVRIEMKHVNWPSRQDVWSTTIVVIVTVAFFGVYFTITDSVFRQLYVIVDGYFKKF